MTYLITSPQTRINDKFSVKIQNIDFTVPLNNFNDLIIKGSPNIDYRFQAEFYKKIGVDIVTETVFNYPYPFITEKTYRSFASLRPCIIVGAFGTLKFLRDIGFKTFSSIINEEYDTIEDPNIRFISVCESIKNFVDRPLEHVKEDLHKIKDDLRFNQLHLKNLIEIQRKKFRLDICLK